MTALVNKELMMTNLTQVSELLKQADGIMIITHRRPDGDTLGGGYALCRALQSLGKRCFIANSSEISPNLRMFSGGKSRLPVEFEPEFIVAVDTAELPLMESLATYGERADICIDHHKTNKGYAKVTLLDDKAASASEVIYDVINELGVPIEGDIASALYVGISTDTGCFRFRNTTPKTMRIAAELMEKGVDFEELNRIFFETVSPERIALEKEMYNNAQIFDCGRLAISYLGRHDYDDEDYEGLCGKLRQIRGVVAAVLLREQDNGDYRISARAHRGFDCSVLCSKFSGGGHEGAAGGTVSGELHVSIERVKEAMSAELRRNK